MPDLAEIHYAHARRIETLVSQAPQIEKALTADAKAALRGHGPICERFIERALCEYAKYWDYALGLKASLWPNRQPLGPKSLGVFLLRDGSLKCKASRAKLSKARSHANAGAPGGRVSRKAKAVLRRRAAVGGQRSGYTGALGIKKSQSVINVIKKVKAAAGRAGTGRAKARICRRCGKGNRASVHVSGKHPFIA